MYLAVFQKVQCQTFLLEAVPDPPGTQMMLNRQFADTIHLVGSVPTEDAQLIHQKLNGHLHARYGQIDGWLKLPANTLKKLQLQIFDRPGGYWSPPLPAIPMGKHHYLVVASERGNPKSPLHLSRIKQPSLVRTLLLSKNGKHRSKAAAQWAAAVVARGGEIQIDILDATMDRNEAAKRVRRLYERAEQTREVLSMFPHKPVRSGR